ncbi:MAG: DUF4145 domain-containing protein [Kastovskya adunca ATA6-11-RM4]|nr:DUF4145 domain-containing protein [Kastovskya adunca ATA6-11-RM4]
MRSPFVNVSDGIQFRLPAKSLPYPLRTRHPRRSLVYSAPRASCFYTRFTLEQAVHWLYSNDPYLQLPYANNLGALIHEQTFQDNLKPGLFPKIRAIHKMGNIAVHDSTSITQRDALNSKTT